MALQENTLYNRTLAPAVKPITAAVNRAVQTMQPYAAPRTTQQNAPKASTMQSQFSGLRGQVREGQKFGNLGTVTVAPGGRTRFESTHPGIDIANKIGTPLPSFTGGKVSQVVSGTKQGSPGYGNYVIITDKEGNNHRYSHLNNAYVQVGQEIPKGYTIGTMGNTGQTYSTSGGTGSHLDYRIKDAYGKYVDPWKYLT